jgi:hypothetical protein
MNTGYFVKSIKNLCRLNGKNKTNTDDNNKVIEDKQKIFCSCLIIDFSSVNYIDEMAVECLKNVSLHKLFAIPITALFCFFRLLKTSTPRLSKSNWSTATVSIKLYKRIKSLKLLLFLWFIDDHIEIMKSLGVYKDIFQEIIYLSVHDAVLAVNRL